MKQKTFVLILIILFVIGLAIGLISGRTTGAFAVSYQGLPGRSYESNFGDPVNLERSNYQQNLWGMAAQERRGGNAVTNITINPNVVYGGEYLNIIIDPGIKGAHKDVLIFKVNDRGFGIAKKGKSQRESGSTSAGFCKSTFKCYDTAAFRYGTSRNWAPGMYQVRVYDYFLKDYAKENFTLLHKPYQQPWGPLSFG